MSNRTIEIKITDDGTGLSIAKQFSVSFLESFRFGRSTLLEMEYMGMVNQLDRAVLDMRMNDSFGGTVDEAKFVDSVPLNPADIPADYKEYTKLQLIEKIDKELEKMNPNPEPPKYDRTFCDTVHCEVSHNCARHIQHWRFTRPVITMEFDVDGECEKYDPMKEDES